MAQDVDHSLLQSPNQQHFLDNPSNISSPAKCTSEQSTSAPAEQNGDRKSSEPVPNDTIDQALSMLRSPEDQAIDGRDSRLVQGKVLRSLPAWIRSFEYPEEGTEDSITSRLLPPHPNDAVVAQHNHSPHATSRPELISSNQGSLDYGREISPLRESRWKNFSKAIAYPQEPGVEKKSVTLDWMNENHGNYSQPWRGQRESWEYEDTEDPLRMKRRREIWFKRFHNTLLKSPMVPLIFRLTVWCFSLTALALGGSIQHLSQEYVHPQGPSALMAIIVDAVALVYLIYITWDEYTSKPLGLRSPTAKARLVLLDIFFIVFDSANLSLAFESLSTVSGACTVGEINQEVTPKDDRICDRQKALASVLLIALIAWLTTFSISVLRLVERAAN